MFKRTRTSSTDNTYDTIDAIKNAKPGDIPHIIGTQSVDDEDLLVAIRDIIPSFSLPDILCRAHKLLQEKNKYIGTPVEQLYNIIKNTKWYMEDASNATTNIPAIYLEVDDHNLHEQILALGFRQDTNYYDEPAHCRYRMDVDNPIYIMYGIQLLRDFDKYPNQVFANEIREKASEQLYTLSSIMK